LASFIIATYSSFKSDPFQVQVADAANGSSLAQGTITVEEEAAIAFFFL
jgi:hypothetical protein